MDDFHNFVRKSQKANKAKMPVHEISQKWKKKNFCFNYNNLKYCNPDYSWYRSKRTFINKMYWYRRSQTYGIGNGSDGTGTQLPYLYPVLTIVATNGPFLSEMGKRTK